MHTVHDTCTMIPICPAKYMYSLYLGPVSGLPPMRLSHSYFMQQCNWIEYSVFFFSLLIFVLHYNPVTPLDLPLPSIHDGVWRAVS
jgi:hypothetical protein